MLVVNTDAAPADGLLLLTVAVTRAITNFPARSSVGEIELAVAPEIWLQSLGTVVGATDLAVVQANQA